MAYQVKPYQRTKPKHLVPSHINPSPYVPQALIPTQGGKNRNVAGRIVTTVQLKNARGEEMNITQVQNILNLTENARGQWAVLDSGMLTKAKTGRRRK